jgi:hypothetical protein
VPFLGNRKEVSQMAQLQDHILDVCDRLPRERTPHPIGETMSSLPRIASYLKNMDRVCGARWVDCNATAMLKAPMVKEAIMIQINPTPASIKSLYAAMRTKILAARKILARPLTLSEKSCLGISGSPIRCPLKHADGTTKELQLRHSHTARQLDWFRAGSVLNTMVN